MKKLSLFIFKTRHIFTVCLMISILLISTKSFSQKASDFSGKWVLNNSKSSPVYARLKSTVVITQTGNKIIIEVTMIPKGLKAETKTEEYVLGTSKGGRSKTKNYTINAAWSADKLSFSITEKDTDVKNGIKEESGNIKTYSLTDEGKILIIKSKDILPEGTTVPESTKQTVLIYDKSN
jgi:hypothetical protein